MTKGYQRSNVPLAFGLLSLALAILACNMNSAKPSGLITCYKGIVPGQTKRADVLTQLGAPADTIQDGANEYLLFPSSYPKQFNTLTIQNDTVVLVDMLLESDQALKFSELKLQYGPAGHVTYSNYQQGSMTYIYPDKGQAFIASEVLDLVFTKQCFVPMSVEEYMKTWGKDLPTQDPFSG
jgi:hypothetical protein